MNKLSDFKVGQMVVYYPYPDAPFQAREYGIVDAIGELFVFVAVGKQLSARPFPPEKLEIRED
jgi:hypothetical protein